MKKHILLLLFFLFLIANTTFAYSVVTHKIISEKATENSKLALDKGDYLKNLGFQNNIDEKFLAKSVRNLIKDGSEDEDLNSKYVNHYHNPLKSWAEAGLFDITTGQSSLLWAQQDIPHEFPNEFSWQAVRRYYLDALTTGSEDSFTKTFKGLGHIIHLLQDTAQPAHVRNDAHVLDPLGIPPLLYELVLSFTPGLETWSKHKPDIISAFASLPVFPTVDLSVSVPGYEPITQFFDTAPGTYNGTNPSTSLSQGLAEYTNANFFSEDTIFAENFDSTDKHYFPFPREEDTIKYDEDIGGGVYRTYFKKISNGEPINHLATVEKLYRYIFPFFITQYNYYFLDENCHNDYTEKLIPRAVGYSTELINYFFRGEIDIIQVPDSNNIKIKNNSSETMDGTFTLYYDATDGNRKPVLNASWTLPPLNAGDTSIELSFTEPTDIAEGTQYTLVFEGTLGSESNSVVGKVFGCNTSAIFVAGPAGGGNGQYDWAVVFVSSLDPAKVNWIAWNDAPQVQLTRPSRLGEVFLGPGMYGTDDHIALTVIAPNGASQTANIDWNDAMGVSSGTQNVIFGTAANAPDVFRQNPYFANPPNVEFFLDEGGSHNAIFSEPGIYEFQFSFQSPYGNGSHGNIYLLINQCQ